MKTSTAPVTLDIARALTIHGWMDREELVWLAEHASFSRVVVEVGSFKGRSTRVLADNVASALGDGAKGVIYAIDPWKHMGGVRRNFEANLQDHIRAGRVSTWAMTFEAAFPTLRGLTADLVFIDDDHVYESVRRHIELGRHLVRPGGILSGHDYHRASWPGVTRAVDEAFPAGVSVCGSIWWVTCP